MTSFLQESRIGLGEKAPAITLSQLRILLEVVLLLRISDTQGAIELVRWILRKNHCVFLSHRKKKMAKYTSAR